MKQILLSLIVVLFSLGAKAQEVSRFKEYPGYSFQIHEGVNTTAHAARVDSILISLQGIVLSSYTDPVTKTCYVRMNDMRIPYQALYDALLFCGYSPSKEYTLLDHEH